MITHQINVHVTVKHQHRKPVEPSGRFMGKHGTDEHKFFILRRAIANCDFKHGDTVMFRRNEYYVSDIYDDTNYIWLEWDGLSPKFIELINGDGEIIYVNPGQLTKVGSRKRRK